VWVLLNGLGILELIFYTMAVGFLGPITMTWFAKKEIPYLDIKRSYLNSNMTKSLFSLSLLLLLLFFFNKIVFYTDNIVIGWWFVGTSMVTFYVGAHKLYSIPSRAINLTLQAMLPAASELDANKKSLALQILLIKVSKYCLALLFLLGIPTLFMSKYILTHWLGENFAVYYMVTNILIISVFFDYFNYVSSQILIGMNKIKFLVACYGVVALLNLILSIILVQSMGLEGVAWGTTIPFIIMALPLMYNAFKIIGIDWKEYAKEVLIKPLPGAAGMVGVLYLLLYFHIPGNLIEIGVYFLIAMGAFFGIFYIIALDKEERNEIKNIFSTLRYKEEKEE
jgi:O-antigen/teichoic acid export membrane protein